MTLQNSINLAITSATPLSSTNGGLGVSNPTAHGILVAEGASAAVTKVLTNGQVLLGSTGADPVAAALTSAGSTIAFTTGAGSLSLDINTVDVAHGGTGATSLTNHGIVVGQGTSAVVEKVLTDGQVLIGSTGADPVGATLTAGSGIGISNAAGAITISATGANPWVDQTGASVTMSSNLSYSANNAGLVTLTLPAVAAFGDEFEIIAAGAGGFVVAQAAGQTIRFGNLTTTTGVGGSVASTGQGDAIKLVCTVANTGFQVINAEGNLNVV